MFRTVGPIPGFDSENNMEATLLRQRVFAPVLVLLLSFAFAAVVGQLAAHHAGIEHQQDVAVDHIAQMRYKHPKAC